MPRAKDSAAQKKLRDAQRESSELTVQADYVPLCHIDNPVVQAEWDRFVPMLIKVNICNVFTEDMINELCFLNVSLRVMESGIINNDTAWYEPVQNYGDGGKAIDGEKEAGKLKTYRQWSARRQDIMKTLGLTPKEMMGLFHFGQDKEDEEDMFT